MSTFDETMSFALRDIRKERLKLKPEQLQAIHNGKGVFLWLPTGFDKSVRYETLPFVFDHKEQSSTSCSSANCSVILVVSLLGYDRSGWKSMKAAC